MRNLRGAVGPGLALLVLGCSFLAAQESSLPRFDLYTADGKVGSGALGQLREDWSITLSAVPPVAGQGADVVALRRTDRPLPPLPEGEHVVLTNGDQLAGTLLDFRGERVHFLARLGNDQEITLPLSTLALVWFAPPGGSPDAEELRRQLVTERRKRDLVLLRNGDRIEGTVTALQAGVLQVDRSGGKLFKVERAQVAVLALSTELARTLRPKQAYGRIVLANGSRLSLASAHADQQQLNGKTLFGAPVQVPVEQLLALDLRQGRAVLLSDLKPARYEHTPYLGVRWPYTLDRSVAGNPLRLGGSTYDKGLGMHSESRLTFHLGGAYRWFEAWVGLDDQTGRAGNVLVEVQIDGKPQVLAAGGALQGGDKPLPLRLSVVGAQQLTLVVRFGRYGDVQDHVDWADARLIK